MAAQRPQPRFPEPDTEPFWEATKNHQLTYQTCNACSEVVFYPRSHCTACGARDLERKISAGNGSATRFIIMQSIRRLPSWAPVPRRPDEGFRIMTTSRGRSGDRYSRHAVKLVWQDQGRRRHLATHV